MKAEVIEKMKSFLPHLNEEQIRLYAPIGSNVNPAEAENAA
jgi:hypothetical protein